MRKIALLTALVTAAAVSQASALDKINTKRFVDSVTAWQIYYHLFQLQRIATRNDDTRALGTPGYSASVRYVVDRMRKARYNVTVQPFIANLFEEHSDAVLDRTVPDVPAYVLDTDFTTMTYSGSGDVTLQLLPTNDIVYPVDPNSPPSTSNSGCEPADFPDVNVVGPYIALIQRGTCFFEDKAQNAFNAGAKGVVIFNEGQPGRTDVLGGTLTNEQPIPVVGTTFAVGEELFNLVDGGTAVTVHLKVDATTTPIQTWNVLAEKKGKVTNQDVVVGAHLDSVPEGPGINDNGSGTAALLTIAEQMTWQHIKPRNTVRFAFWGAEEGGLFGSNFYVANLTDEQFANISLNLNFDMVGSPNFVRFVYDGDGTIGDPGPAGSDVIEQVFTDFFNKRGLASEPTLFDGRSDYFAFIQNDIPAGGLFSGAEGIKTPAQQALYGGTAGVAYDPCYHQACDTIKNLNFRSLSQLGKAAAHSVLYFAQTKENVRPAAAAAIAAARSAASSAEYRGSHLVR
jgi:Zn-dependent M28 family amino/carboxypeptidase